MHKIPKTRETPEMSFIYKFTLATDPTLGRLSDETQASVEKLIVNVIYEAYVTSADEDYLSARLLAVKGLPRSFGWGAGQALEKYFKAFLLFRGEKVLGKEFRGHPVRKLYDATVRLDPSIANIDMSPHPNINADLHAQAHIKTIPLPDFIDIVETIGDPDNRYNANGVDFDTSYIFALDSFIYSFRSRIGAPSIECSFAKFDEDLLKPFYDNNPHFCHAQADAHSQVATHSFRLLRQLGCSTQQYLVKNESSFPNMHALYWLRQRMRM